MKTSEFCKIEKDVTENSCAMMFQIREAVGRSQMFFKISVQECRSVFL